MSRTNSGFLVLADVSGFTEFVTGTELEHGPPIIADLLEKVIERIAPPLAVFEIEGDAVFALGVDGTVVPPGVLPEILESALAAFRERQRELEQDDSCDCNACRGVWRLRLKMIGHYGAFLEHTIGGRAQVAGREVILAHRLLKNELGQTDNYTLLTRPALEAIGVAPEEAGFQPYVERYEHFGDVECFVRDAGAVSPATPAAVLS